MGVYIKDNGYGYKELKFKNIEIAFKFNKNFSFRNINFSKKIKYTNDKQRIINIGYLEIILLKRMNSPYEKQKPNIWFCIDETLQDKVNRIKNHKLIDEDNIFDYLIDKELELEKKQGIYNKNFIKFILQNRTAISDDLSKKISNLYNEDKNFQKICEEIFRLSKS